MEEQTRTFLKINRVCPLVSLSKMPQKNSSPARVYHDELWGNRKDKYDWLATNIIDTTPWKELTPISPNYLFVSPQ